MTDAQRPAALGNPPGAPVRPRTGEARWTARAFYPLAAVLLPVVALGPLLSPEFLGGAAEATRSLARLQTVGSPDWSLWSGTDGPATSLAAFVLTRAGVLPTDALKAVMGLALVASALTMYCFAADLWGRRGGLLSAVLFVYSPVRLVDLYVRGAIAESVAWLLPPLALWAGRRAMLQSRGRIAYALVAVMALVSLPFTHLGVALLTVPVMGLFWAWLLAHLRREPRRRADRVFGVALLLLACLASVVSGAVVLGAAGGEAVDAAALVVFPHQLLSPRWGYGAPSPGPNDTLSLELGLAPVALTAVAVVSAFWLTDAGRPVLRLSRRRRATLAFFAVSALVATLLTLPVTLPFWVAVPGAAILQLPWRLLSVAAFGLAIGGGACGLLSFGRPVGQIALATFIGVAILAVFPYLQTPDTVFRPPTTAATAGR
ncbi:MAG: hypothetical protein KatS3mg060_2842 [Dehalococcoidia bacterium]|nr:MAG: hypothetical protein KatS3mg060_2842 [Dehalococcoidia bacterium]